MQRRSPLADIPAPDRPRALRYERVRQAMVAELCAPGVGPAVGAAQVAATLAFAADVGATPGRVFELPDRVTADWVIRMLAAPRRVRLGWPDGATSRAWVKVDDPVLVLSRFGCRGGRSWAFGGRGRDGAAGAIRGAIAAAGELTRGGLRIMCPKPQMAIRVQHAGAAVVKPTSIAPDVHRVIACVDHGGAVSAESTVVPGVSAAGVPVDRHDAYRWGLCVDCFTAPHSAGRPRCETCHDIYARGVSARKPGMAPAAAPGAGAGERTTR